MLGDDLEAVVLRRIQGRDHGIVDHLTDGAAIIGWLAPDEIDASERHATTPFPLDPYFPAIKKRPLRLGHDAIDGAPC